MSKAPLTAIKAERRREQNRRAQRKYREKLRKRQMDSLLCKHEAMVQERQNPESRIRSFQTSSAQVTYAATERQSLKPPGNAQMQAVMGSSELNRLNWCGMGG